MDRAVRRRPRLVVTATPERMPRNAALSAADDAGVLTGAADLERLALCAQLTGSPDLAEAVWARSHESFLAEGDVRSAVRGGALIRATCMTGRDREGAAP